MSVEKSDYRTYLEKKNVEIFAVEIDHPLFELANAAVKKAGVTKREWATDLIIEAVRAAGFEYTPPATTPKGVQALKAVLSEKDAEIAALKAQIAAQVTPPTPPALKADASGNLVPQA